MKMMKFYSFTGFPEFFTHNKIRIALSFKQNKFIVVNLVHGRTMYAMHASYKSIDMDGRHTAKINDKLLLSRLNSSHQN